MATDDFNLPEELQREAKVASAIERLHDATVGRCTKCDNGFIEEKSRKIRQASDLIYGNVQYCDCYKAYQRYRNYIVSEIPKEFWGVRDMQMDFGEVINKKISTYITKFDKVFESGFGILFLGSPDGIKKPNSGTGKTTIAAKVLGHALESGKTAHYTTMHSYFHLIYRSMDDDGVKYKKLIDEIDSVDFLVIDEVGKIKKSEYVYYRFEDMLRRRSSQLLVTLIVTNMNEVELEEFVGPSIMDIFRNTMMKIILVGQSHRNRRFISTQKAINLIP